jgi:hypothetical protein
MFLHAHRLRFTHPESGEEMDVESELPAELKSMMIEIERVYPARAVPT